MPTHLGNPWEHGTSSTQSWLERNAEVFCQDWRQSPAPVATRIYFWSSNVAYLIGPSFKLKLCPTNPCVTGTPPLVVADTVPAAHAASNVALGPAIRSGVFSAFQNATTMCYTDERSRPLHWSLFISAHRAGGYLLNRRTPFVETGFLTMTNVR